MLKLNSSGGKLDITITDESLFGTGKKGIVKPHKGHMVKRQSHSKGKEQTEPITASISEKGPRGREVKQSKPVKRALAIKQGKANSKQEKTPRPLSVSKSKPHDAGVISKTHLDNILLLLNTEEASTGKEFSPDHLESQLIASLGKSKPTDFKGNEVCVKSDDINLGAKRKEARNESVSSKTENKDQENENQINNTVQVDEENKRLKWKRELDEQVLLKKKAKEEEKQKSNKDVNIEEYNPWGRPGAGAPIRSQSGKVLANYQNRPAVSKKQNDIPKNESFTAKETLVASLVPSCHASSIVSQPRSSPVTTVATSTSDTSDVNTTIPVAMRSSFAIGAPGLVARDTQLKRLQEIQWKQELQKQIEGKKERERQRKLKEAQEDFLNLSWNAKRNLNVVSPPQRTTDMNNQVSETYGKKPSEDIPLQSTQDSSTPLLHASLNGSLKTHARGFGMQLMDPQAKEEAEKKRLKMLEHQLAIQEQVEEKRRIKQQEREQRLRDEAIEEARFAEEREKLNKAFIMEQKQKREKEEEAKRISEALQQSVLDAYQASQRAKADKRRKHLGATGQDTRTGETTSRSYVVSQATSETQQIAPDFVHGMTGDKSVQSNYEVTQVALRTTPRTKRTPIGRSSQASADRVFGANPGYREKDTVVPPLNLTDRNSPPVPTLRNKKIEKYEFTSPKSSSAVSPAATKRNLHRTVSSHSEPCDGSLALSSSKRVSKGNDVGGVMAQCDNPLSDSIALNDDEFNRPFSTFEDAFMIPFHRTDSATLPAQPETPEPTTSQGVTNISPRMKNGKEVNTLRYHKNVRQNNGKTITPIYRTVSSYLKPERGEPEVSPRRAKGNKSIRSRHQSQSTKAIPSARSGHKETKNTQQRKTGKQLEKKALKDHATPRNDVSSVLSTHQIPPEPLQTARQEIILQQLASLRQGLIIKERELKQDTIHHFV